MATRTYQTSYALDFNDDGQLVILIGNSDYPYTIDGGSDGVLNVGDPLPVSFYIDELGYTFNIEYATYVGSTPDGFVFAQENPPGSGPIYYMLSDNPEIPEDSVVEPQEEPFIVCFLAGTLIATPAGERAIESLQPGDLVLTRDGRVQPVKWLFVQTVSTLFADPARVAPVHIRAGALGENMPVRDLLISGDHALLIDGVLVQAAALIDGVTITRETELPERFCYYHIELADHALILAEGVAAETFIDNVGRRAFDNWREYEAVHGEGAAIAELDLPRIKSARQLPGHRAA